ncbi:MAG: low molecular weight phosphatase family protein [Pseudomonadota bacterium]
MSEKPSILFVCNMNSVRSPMAAALLSQQVGGAAIVDSAGVYEGWLDPFVEAVMQELELSLEDHEPKAMKSLDLEAFDAIIALTREAADAAAERVSEEKVEFWDVPNPSNARRERDEVMAAYRATREMLATKIADRFKGLGA